MKSTIDRPASAGEELAAALDEGVGSVVAALPPSLLESPSYPVQVIFERPPSPNPFWAVPIIGLVAKAIILIPHFVALALLGTVVVALQFVVWIPVLFTGLYPDWAFTLVSGTLRWGVRVEAYFFGLTDEYPPFALGEPAGVAYPVHVSFERQPTYNQGWAIPVLGILVKSVLLIPHALILSLMRIVAEVLILVTWMPVLFSGTYPEWGYQLIGGYFRWSTRVYAYFLGLTDRYPPFQMG